MKKNGVGIRKKLLPNQILIIGFICLILFGTFLLMLPISSRSREFTGFTTALFTATSSTCVTGLSVVTTATYWSLFGQLVILSLIQLGGIGFMSMAVLIMLLLRRSVSPYQNLIVAQAFSLSKIEDAASVFTKRIIIGTFSIEGVGAMILAVRFIPKYGFGGGIYRSIFHSVSAFCNAGFDIFGENSAMPFNGDYTVMGVLSLLIIIGGIGFIVWNDLIGLILHKTRLSIYTKLVLITTAALLLLGTVTTAVFEWNGTLDGMSGFRKIYVSFFHSASLRTAGFSIVNCAEMTDKTNAVSMLLMFIGGASGSTAGGIKVSTLAVIVISAVQVIAGAEDITVFKRKLSPKIFARAASLVMAGLLFISISAVAVSEIEGISLFKSLYETISAYATVGLSLGITSLLGTVSKLLLVLLMFMGRVGLFTITFSFLMRKARKLSVIKYPETEIMIG